MWDASDFIEFVERTAVSSISSLQRGACDFAHHHTTAYQTICHTSNSVQPPWLLLPFSPPRCCTVCPAVQVKCWRFWPADAQRQQRQQASAWFAAGTGLGSWLQQLRVVHGHNVTANSARPLWGSKPFTTGIEFAKQIWVLFPAAT